MIECTDLVFLNDGYCVAIAEIYIKKMDLDISNIKVFQKGEKEWISLPSRRYEVNGKYIYKPVIKFRNKDLHNKFMIQVKEAIDKKIEIERDNIFAKEEHIF